jgi:hypothetical protein
MHVAHDADHLAAGYERVAFAGKGHGPLFDADPKPFANRIFAGPKAVCRGFTDDDNRRLAFRFDWRESAPAQDGNL